MRALIKLAAVLLVGFVILGFCLGWFHVSSSTPDPQNGDKVNYNVSVDKSKIKTDVKNFEEKIEGKFKEIKDKEHAQDAKPGVIAK
jgi:hypothetical protein